MTAAAASRSGFAIRARVAVTCEIGMRQRVSFVSPVALAVRQIFQNGRDRILVRVFRQPDAGGELRAVFQGDQNVLDDAHRSRKRRNNHGRPLMMAAVCRPAATSEEDNR